MGDDAIFYLDGDTVVPTINAQGPWDLGAQHGGAVAGVLARAVERVPTPVPMRVARFTLDMLRRVPVKPLAVSTEVLRTGKRIQTTRANLYDGEQLVASAVAVSVRTGAEIEVFPIDNPRPRCPLRRAAPRSPWHSTPGVDGRRLSPCGGVRRVDGSFRGGTPSKTWVRLLVPLVRGEKTSSLVT